MRILAGLAFLAVVACNDKRATVSETLDRPAASFILTNPRAVKLPIHVQFSAPTVGWAYYGDSTDATVDECRVQQVRATAYDANNRQLSDSLVTWRSLAPDTATVDDSGWVRPATCWKDNAGHVTLMNAQVGIVATLKFTK